MNTNSHESQTKWSYLVSDYVFNSPILINKINASTSYYSYTCIITWYQSVQNQQQSEHSKIIGGRNMNKRTATRNDDKRSHQHHKLLTVRNTKFINSKFTSQIKENQSWPKSKTQTLLLLKHPPPHQYHSN